MLPSPRDTSTVSELNEFVFKYRTKFKRSLDCNRKFFIHYGSIAASFTIGIMCWLVSMLMRLFLVFYQVFCWGLDESTGSFPLSSDESIHVVVAGPYLVGDTARYVSRLSEIHGLRQLNEEDIVYEKEEGKTSVHRSVLKGRKHDGGWIMDINAMPSVPDKYLLRYSTHLIWIDHSNFVVFARLIGVLFSECLFGGKRWVKAFGVWRRDCDLVLQFQSIEANRKKATIFKRFATHCDVEKCKLYVINDVDDENTLLRQ